MANPRKFSEKIALHNQKQAEETAAFEKIMREVSDATNKPEETTLVTQYGLGGGGRSGGASPSRSPGQRGRTSSSVGPMRRPADRKHDTSPYGSTVYLSPPPDCNWRRTHSDSALHQSCEQPTTAPLSPHHHSLRQHQHQHLLPHQNHHRPDIHLDLLDTMGMNPNNRPRSSCEIPRIPNNNNVYSSGDGGGGGGGTAGTLGCGELQVPGGSLPDLTSVHFPAPGYRPSPDYHQHRYSPTSPGGSVSPATGGLSPASGSPVGATVPHPLQQHQHPHDHNALYDTQNMSPLDHGLITSGYQSHCSPPSQYSSTSNINIPSPTMVNSPGSPVESPQNDYSNLHQALLQPFEQITMLDYPVTTYSSTYMNHSSPHSPQTTNSAHTYPQTSEAHGGSGGECGPRSRGRDPVPGGAFVSLASPSAPPTPATPASIPDIILTDFDRVNDYTGELDAGIFGGEEAQLRAGLDLDDLTLLEEPSSLLPDSSVEHVFRLDRL